MDNLRLTTVDTIQLHLENRKFILAVYSLIFFLFLHKQYI